MTEDALNSIFEMSGAAFVLLHVRRVWIDKMVRGVSCVAVAFFTMWGFWNLHYYTVIDQHWSFGATIAMVAANAVYVASLIYWSKK
jgi:hypothetical protein